MQILLWATGETDKLRPLTESMPSPMLPVANRPAMVYLVEALARQGYKQMFVSLYHLGGSVEAYFGDGRRWGIAIDYLLQREAWGLAGAMKWAEHALTDTFMVLPADAIIDLDIDAILAQHRAQKSAATLILRPDGFGETVCLDTADRVIGVGDGLDDGRQNGFQNGRSLRQTGIAIFEPHVLEMIPARTPFDVDRQLVPALLAAALPVHGVVNDGYWNPLASFSDYQAAQQAALTYTGSAGHVLDGTARSLEARQIANGIWVGRNHVIHPSARLAPPVYIGDNCQIGRNVELGPNVALGKNVIIDDEATVSQSAVLDNTYVGQLVNIENRVVRKNLMIDIATAESSEVTDEFLLGEAHPALLDNGLQRVWDTAVALVLLTLTLPLTILLGLLALLSTGRIFTRVERLGGQIGLAADGRSPILQALSLVRFNTRRANGRQSRLASWLEKWDLHRLPELWNALKGDISLVGVKPLQPAQVDRIIEAWQLQRHQNQAGLTGLWYIQTDQKSELDEILITDTYYVATRTWREDMKILRQTPAAWAKRAGN